MAAPAPDFSMRGKTVLLTGATGGLGSATARELARRGAHLLLVGRNPQKLATTLAEVQQAGAAAGASAEVLVADLSLLSDVRQLAEEVTRHHAHLDVLINNAGIMGGKHTITAEGHELSWATNHLAPFVLTNHLLPLLLAAPQGRIINVASEAHWLGQIEASQEVRNARSRYSGITAYCDSKLANILFTNELAHRLDLTNITANCLHPGLVDTGLMHPGAPRLMRTLWWMAKPLLVSPEHGARTTVYLATSPEVARVSGQYFKNSRPGRFAERAGNRAEAFRLWRISAEETGVAG
ncbi:SDR family NAD(P)-dependent oxidoreductase [Hymenobacter guriensis]|uniref:SDR family NAD(P)-dependent oxidoreductase n=1 Tax=Hymenobacter guriensis TaxID=2793065 RepID=A0ABS0L1J0_9BACT|nr:SDR family NAD(P)-dependent oxidoreductase [Hymenobacter guriensis]MBG8553938.1 SDR family NAD(P)-dependent oxidoreductase [Hymenobacter guriensis]